MDMDMDMDVDVDVDVDVDMDIDMDLDMDIDGAMDAPGDSSNQDEPTIPKEDKQFLSDMGYDAAAYLGEGKYGCVFSGICNTRATKIIALPPHKKQEATSFDPISKTYFKEISLNGRSCAIKMFFDSEEWTASSYNEAKTMLELDHPNIVEIFAVFKTPNTIYIIMELLNGGSLRRLLLKALVGRKLDEATAFQIIRQTIAGLKYLHNEGKAHLDLHTGNVLLSFEGTTCLCKIADFGSSAPLTENYKMGDFFYVEHIIDEILFSTDFKSPQIEKDLKELASNLNDEFSLLKDINQFAEELAKILPPIHVPIEVPVQVPKNSLLSRISKFFKKKRNTFR